MARITIVLDDKNNKQLRELQAKWLTETNQSWSFSRVLNEVVVIGLKKMK